MTQIKRKMQDRATALIHKKLKAAFPSLSDDPNDVVYRYNPASIRLRVTDPSFEGMSFERREAAIRSILQSLPSRVRTDITLILLLTPEECEDPTDLMNLEFDDPAGSRL